MIEFLWLFVSICDSFLTSSTLLICDFFIDFLLFFLCVCVWPFFLWLFCDFFFLLLCYVSFLMWCFLFVTFFPVIFVTLTWSGCFNLCSSEISHLSKLPWQVWNQFSSSSFKKLAELPQSWQMFGAIHGCYFARLLYMRWWAMMVGPKIMFDHLADSSKPGRFPATLCVLLLQVPISRGLGENPERRRQEPLNTS